MEDLRLRGYLVTNRTCKGRVVAVLVLRSRVVRHERIARLVVESDKQNAREQYSNGYRTSSSYAYSFLQCVEEQGDSSNSEERDKDRDDTCTELTHGSFGYGKPINHKSVVDKTVSVLIMILVYTG